MWRLNAPFCSHTETLWHELSDVSSWNEAVPECQRWSKTRCTWDTERAGSRETAAPECFIQAFSGHVYAVQMCELAPSWLCSTCFLGCQNHLTVPADFVSSSATHSSLLLQLSCFQLIYSACQESWEFLPIMVCRAAIPSAATLLWTLLRSAFTATHNRLAESLKISQSNQRWF